MKPDLAAVETFAPGKLISGQVSPGPAAAECAEAAHAAAENLAAHRAAEHLAPGNGMTRIAPQSGTAFRLRRHQVLRVCDPCGEQVADLFAFADGESTRSLSSGRSIDYAGKVYLSTGDLLYSNDSEPMFTIVADAVGRHDFLLTPCSQRMFEILYGHRGHHPSCFENLAIAFAGYGIDSATIGTTFNIFMNVTVAPDGAISVEKPKSRAGDFIELRAEMDMICALTACSAEQSNNGAFKPIDYRILDCPEA